MCKIYCVLSGENASNCDGAMTLSITTLSIMTFSIKINKM
jgi:hypothetical protein